MERLLQGGVDPAWLFFIDDSATIIHAAAVTHLVLFENYGLVIDAWFCSIEGYFYPLLWLSLPEAMSTTGACSTDYY